MNTLRPTILKIGGSAITDKESELSARTQIIDRLADEIRRANVKNLLIVHGGGSFGHPAAQRNSIKEGLKSPDQMIGFAETHHFMTVLNGLFMDALILHGVAAISITPSTFIVAENGRIKSFEDIVLGLFLKMGFLPVLYGDVVLDTKLGFTVISGDQLVSTLATRFNAERIMMGVDVDGLYEADPKTSKSARKFTRLTFEEIKKIQGTLEKPYSHDVTGGMFGKISELLNPIEQGIPVAILNATKPDRVFKALKGEKTEGTLIEKG